VKIVVDVSAHKLTLYRAGRVVMSSPCATGKDGGPIGIHGTNESFSIGQPVSHG